MFQVDVIIGRSEGGGQALRRRDTCSRDWETSERVGMGEVCFQLGYSLP